ncbi:hypothetical protein NE237_005346 [Protea cynaroides]|uniref:Strictosidine synthase conserved region domain-containing protein n=1 Tax=Protea cynaroides TaxID=273540 RepID=A0A9Q0KKF8_9MAGN|nr:hypothetical protein NE237_005346 [Protea cynaroides]
MNWKLFLTATTLGVLCIFLSRSPIQLFLPPSIPGSQDKLQAAEVIPLVGAVGPESLAFDPNGEGPYTGVANGRILKWQGQAQGWTEFSVTSPQREDCVRPFAPEMEHLCGRPLGLKFHPKTGDLYIADAYLGLHMVSPDGGPATKLVNQVEGEPLRFINDMDIHEEENAIYFTDTSTVFQRRQFMAAIVSVDKTGRLLKYDISTKEVTVLLRGLAFANGVALSKDRSFVLVAETTSCRVLRYWLQGPKAGTQDVFAVLPGFPDNVRRNSKGEFWVALHAKKGFLANLILSNSFFGKTLLKLPISIKQLHLMFVGFKAHATAVKLNEEGQVVEVLEDCDGRNLKFISEVEEKDGDLWIGSVLMPFMARRYKLGWGQQDSSDTHHTQRITGHGDSPELELSNASTSIAEAFRKPVWENRGPTYECLQYMRGRVYSSPFLFLGARARGVRFFDAWMANSWAPTGSPHLKWRSRMA